MTAYRRYVSVIIIIALAIAAVAVGLSARGRRNQSSRAIDEVTLPKFLDESTLPKFLEADFIELDKIEEISPFRGAAGHDYSSDSTGETCRTKKHYFSPYMWVRGGETQHKIRKELDAQGLPIPPPEERLAAKIFSPVDGVITSNDPTHWGWEVTIRPAAHEDFLLQISHIWMYPGIETGTQVTAGQAIGFTANSTDIVVEWSPGRQELTIGGPDSRHERYLVSYFSVMPDQIFSKYVERGIADREKLVFKKSLRDTLPFECDIATGLYSQDYYSTMPEVTIIRLAEVSG